MIMVFLWYYYLHKTNCEAAGPDHLIDNPLHETAFESSNENIHAFDGSR